MSISGPVNCGASSCKNISTAGIHAILGKVYGIQENNHEVEEKDGVVPGLQSMNIDYSCLFHCL